MRLLLFVTSLLATSFAWLPPQRCQQSRKKRDLSEVVEAPVVPSIEEVQASQYQLLTGAYKDYDFPGVALRADINPVSIYSAYNCKFFSYNPRLIGSVACHSGGCKLTRSVATTESYTASEGYNWSVKASAKWTIVEKVFEVGAEAAVGGTYTCAYTKGKTTTQTVECSESSGRSGQLQLYTILTDMKCDIGTTILEEDPRDSGKSLVSSDYDFVSDNEQDQIMGSASAFLEPRGFKFLIDPDKISDRLIQKLMKEFPLYNPYTDVVQLNETRVIINYRKRGSFKLDYTKVMPFTNDNGDAVYQYACLFTK